MSQFEIKPISLAELLVGDYDTNSYENTIFEVSLNEYTKFVDMWNKDNLSVPEVKIICGNIALDNSEGECFCEEFSSRDKTIKYLRNQLSLDEIFEL